MFAQLVGPLSTNEDLLFVLEFSIALKISPSAYFTVSRLTNSSGIGDSFFAQYKLR